MSKEFNVLEVLEELNKIVPGWEYCKYSFSDDISFSHRNVYIHYDFKNNFYKSVSNVYSTHELLLMGFGDTATKALKELEKQIENHLEEVMSILYSIQDENE